MGRANLVTLELNVHSAGAGGEAGALVSLHWQFMGACGKLLSIKCLSFQTLSSRVSVWGKEAITGWVLPFPGAQTPFLLVFSLSKSADEDWSSPGYL